MNAPETFTALLEYVRRALEDADCLMPPHLEPHSFSWTGGGVGPAPPIDVAASVEANR